MIRLIVPDSHGHHIDPDAVKAMFKRIKPFADDIREIVLLGDHLDCGGFFSSHHKPCHISEIEDDYEKDYEAANKFLDKLQAACPRAIRIHYLGGNHEHRIHKWCAQNFSKRRDAQLLFDALKPERVLDLDRRGIQYYEYNESHQGLKVPGAIRLGKCYFVHGITHGVHCAATHLNYFRDNVVFGHVHRIQSHYANTVTSTIGAWCVGTLAHIQPYYFHGVPTNHVNAFGWQEVAKSGLFQMHTEVLF